MKTMKRFAAVTLLLLIVCTVSVAAEGAPNALDSSGWRFADFVIVGSLLFHLGVTVQRFRGLEEKVKTVQAWIEKHDEWSTNMELRLAILEVRSGGTAGVASAPPKGLSPTVPIKG